jgi:hypothetical protein
MAKGDSMPGHDETYDRLLKLMKSRVNVRKIPQSLHEATVSGATMTVEEKT